MADESQMKSIDGVVSNTEPKTPISTGQSSPQENQGDEAKKSPESNDINKPASEKLITKTDPTRKYRILLFTFIILFALSVCLIIYGYIMYNDKLSNRSDSTFLRSQSLQTEVDTLKKDKGILTDSLRSQTEYVDKLKQTATELKTKCGNACNSISIPQSADVD